MSAGTGKLMLGGLAVFYALLFDFLNYSAGRLQTLGTAIAKEAAVDVADRVACDQTAGGGGVSEPGRRCVDGWGWAIFPADKLLIAYRPLGPGTGPEPLPGPGTWGDHPLPSIRYSPRAKGQTWAPASPSLRPEGRPRRGACASRSRHEGREDP